MYVCMYVCMYLTHLLVKYKQYKTSSVVLVPYIYAYRMCIYESHTSRLARARKAATHVRMCVYMQAKSRNILTVILVHDKQFTISSPDIHH